jgi:hypothetical protein
LGLSHFDGYVAHHDAADEEVRDADSAPDKEALSDRSFFHACRFQVIEIRQFQIFLSPIILAAPAG